MSKKKAKKVSKASLPTMDDVKERFAKHLVEILNERGMSAKELAELAEVGPMDVSRAIHGTRVIRADKMLRIAMVLGVRLESLLSK